MNAIILSDHNCTQKCYCLVKTKANEAHYSMNQLFKATVHNCEQDQLT